MFRKWQNCLNYFGNEFNSLCSKCQKVSDESAQKICLAKNEWNFVSWTMVCFRKKLIGVRQRFWNLVIFCPNWERSSKFFFDTFGKISANLKLFGKWKVKKWHSWWCLVENSPFFNSDLFERWYGKIDHFQPISIRKANFPLFNYQKV